MLLLLNPYTITKEKQCISSTSKMDPPNMDCTPILTENLHPLSSMIFQKSQLPLNKDGGGVHSL